MKKFLPKLYVLLFIIGIVAVLLVPQATAQVPDGSWVIDKEVTFIGKNAARSGLLLDWTLQDYKWASVSAGMQNPLIPFWVTIRNIVYALFILFVIATAFILVTTRGRSLAAKRFLPRFLVVVLLVTFSFSLIQFLYQITDGIQGFFLRTSPSVPCPPECISQKDLFYWSWDYREFIGLRKVGDENSESAYISLILTKLSAMTYYVMIGILLVRKIILWFFIIVSPIFPLLLLYYPVRNTAKIWIGEFFRWLFYAPLFAVFLAGLVSLWRQQIPMRFLTGGEGVYPTAVNILLAGPQQSAAFNNSVNLTDTYALYVVALIMLWVVIILPFILLQIFLDYMSNISFRDNPAWSQMITMINKRFPPNPPPVTPVPPGPASTGLAKALPFRNRFQMPTTTGLAREVPRPAAVPAQVNRQQSISNRSEIEKMTSITVPTMRDIARLETARLQKDTSQLREISKIRENLEKIANPASITSSVERDRFVQMRDSLIKERDLGNPMAASILKAAESMSKVSTSSKATSETNTLKEVLQSIAKPEVVKSLEKDKYVELRDRLIKESEKGNTVATTILNTANTLTESTSTTSVVETKTIKEVISQLAAPSTITNSSERERVASLKEQLIQQEKSGNTVAREVLATIEKVSSTTTSQEEKEQQITRLKDALIKETEKGNTLASSLLALMRSEKATTDRTNIKEIIRQLASPNTVTNATDREKVTSLKDQLIKEEKAGNQVAEKVLSAIREVQSASSETEREKVLTELREALLQEANKGNDLAISVLSSIKTEGADVDVQKVKDKLEKAKANGDSLAATLLALLASKEAEKKVAADTKAIGKAAIPTTNRIQQVSLDDYEAVKDMWVENYQNLDVPQSLEGEQSRSQWIEEDMSQIEDTINLLSSTNEEDIQKGMEQVSNILPFLLIGGFSQEEIKAYLKAKLEAGKVALKIVEATKSEEDTLLEVKKSATEQAKTMTTSQEATIPTMSNDRSGSESYSSIAPSPSVSQNSSSGSSSDLSYESGLKSSSSHASDTRSQQYTGSRAESVSSSGLSTDRTGDSPEHATEVFSSNTSEAGNPQHTTIIKPQITLNVTAQLPEESKKILHLANITIPKMMEIAKYEASLKSGRNADSAKEMLNAIANIANPNVISDPQKKAQVASLRDLLIKESQKGNPVAESILSAAGVADKEKVGSTQGQLGQIIKLLKDLFDPTQIKNPTEREKYIDLKKKIEEKALSGEPLASAIMQTIKRMNQDYVFAVHELYAEIKDPQKITERARAEKMQKIHEILEQEQKTGNMLAGNMLKDTTSDVTIDNILKTKVELTQEKEKGNTIAQDILTEFPAIPAVDTVSAQNIKKVLDTGLSKKDPLAVYVQTFLLRKEDIKDDNILLPESNKLQAVSLDDYESVKKLWMDNYRNAETKDEDLVRDEKDITDAVNLLASPDKERIEQGMEKVSLILPFLLIGGFSQSEVVSYLKAKREAIKAIKAEREEAEEKISTERLSSHTQKTADQKIAEELDPNDAEK
jgi:hypothetical protein